ncbi:MULTISPECIES: ATP-binding protein [Mycobacterium]|uniref:ATP-binding protein n=1 Tax=Mycobacterium TaxID=1763 RepID=UPI00096353BD|nr:MULTISPECIES: adenylate/guanylate cyclase domain-containing protein [Mycobacterium]MCG7606791.1 AAA family ATPase [Mycobacterium sp. CnD-18-1]OLT98178.1 adenylyl cyclase [Mycobacterium syngnathidarum]
MAGPVGETAGRCRSCGSHLRTRSRFCDMCGAAVASQATPSEHKQVTVLFADVVGSMKLAAAVDTERLREIMNELFNRAAAVVQRYGGTVDKFTGDGLMALFGAPAALEDHALRACIAALEIQSGAKALAAEVLRRDGVALRLRVGLNSGEVVAGDIGSGGYTAVGHPVGLAQRMESAAPAGGVMCSLSTARLVEDTARLGTLEQLTVKGFDQPVPACQLFAVETGNETGNAVLGRNDGVLLGREAELNRLQEVFDSGRGRIVDVIGEPGLGKSRLVSVFVSGAQRQGARVVVTRGEAHASVVAFRMLSLLLRSMFQVDGLSPAAARKRTIAQFAGRLPAQSPNARMLFEAMGIGDDAGPGTRVANEDRRRRLVKLMSTAVRVCDVPIVFVLEDVHWIDVPSDDVLADFAAEISDVGAATVVATYRPEYHGALSRVPGETITLQPLPDSTSARLIEHLLGDDDPSLAGLAARIAAVAAGNPYFIEEIIRDLAGRGVLAGSRGRYRPAGDLGRIWVPPTIQAVLAARIDRLSVQAKRVLNAAAVIGAQFDTDTLRALQPDLEADRLSELVSADLIDQTEFVPQQRYCFHHPLVRTVAYESQLSRDRAAAHGCLAIAIERHNPQAADENAALIAAHLEAAGDLVAAYRWHMRAGQWIRLRDIPAAREQWEHAQRIADRLSDGEAGAADMRVAPRTLLVSTSLYVGNNVDTAQRYREFRDLAMRTEDSRSLAIGMAGQLWAVTVNDENIEEAAVLASELYRMTETANWDGEATGIVVNAVAFTMLASCEFDSALRALDLLAVDHTPAVELAPAQALRGVLELCLGNAEAGRRHLREGIELARADAPMTYTHTVLYAGAVVALGLCDPEEFIDDLRDAVRAANMLGESSGVVCSEWAYGTAALRARRGSDADAIVGLRRALSYVDQHSSMTFIKPTIIADLAIDAVRKGDRAKALTDLRAGFARYAERGSRVFLGYLGEALVEILVGPGSGADKDELAEARRLVGRWQQLRPGIPALDMWWLRSRALLAQAEGDATGHAELSAQYLKLCERLDARGRLADARRMA